MVRLSRRSSNSHCRTRPVGSTSSPKSWRAPSSRSAHAFTAIRIALLPGAQATPPGTPATLGAAGDPLRHDAPNLQKMVMSSDSPESESGARRATEFASGRLNGCVQETAARLRPVGGTKSTPRRRRDLRILVRFATTVGDRRQVPPNIEQTLQNRHGNGVVSDRSSSGTRRARVESVGFGRRRCRGHRPPSIDGGRYL